jgi:hypothetical protein
MATSCASPRKFKRKSRPDSAIAVACIVPAASCGGGRRCRPNGGVPDSLDEAKVV